jgi:general secretion pathway protein G
MLLQQRSDRRRTRSAFTLLEVLIVVAIIVMLSGAGSYFFFQQYEDARASTAKMGCNSLSGLAEQYKLAHGDYPASLQALTQQIDGKGPYCEQKDILDPWGQPYQIDPTGPNHQGLKADIFTVSKKGVRITN